MRINNIKEISIKELKSQFDHISGYILAAIFVGLIYFFFLKTFFINGVVSLRSMFDLFPWFFAVFIPAITMGSFASETEKQTLEYLNTKPIKPLDLILGKIIGASKIVFITILLTLPLPFFISRIAPLDFGETFSGYLGSFILALALVSLGVAVSSFYKNQIVAFITSSVLIVLFIFINSELTAINLPVAIANSLAQFSIVDNYSPMIRGVISLNNIVYFVIFIVTSIAIAYTNIQKIRISNTTELYKRTFSTIILVAFAGITLVYLADYFGQQIGRIDLTSDKRYTLSSVTNDILAEDGKIIVEVFASKNLPSRYQITYNEVKNLLVDYRSASKGNLEIRYLDPEVNGERLNTFNIQPVQFNTVGEDELQIQQGYLALGIANEDETKTEKIDFIQSVNDMEYQLTSYISKIKATSKPIIGFVAGNGEKGLFTDYSYMQQVLASEYDLRSVYLAAANEEPDTTTETEETPADPNLSQYKMIVIAGPKNNYDETSLNQINDYINNGGSVLYLADMKEINNETGAVSSLEGTGQLLSEYGATINNDMVYDLQNGLQVPMGTVITKYPYFIISDRDINTTDIIQFLPQTVLNSWTSSLNLDSSWQWLYTTSASGGIRSGAVDINPQQQFPNENLDTLPLIAIRKTDSGGTLVIAGNSRILDNQFASAFQENAILGLALFEHMGNGRGLSQIKTKNLLTSQFTYVENNIKQMVNYGAPITSLALLAIIGASRIYRKRKLAKVYA